MLLKKYRKAIIIATVAFVAITTGTVVYVSRLADKGQRTIGTICSVPYLGIDKDSDGKVTEDEAIDYYDGFIILGSHLDNMISDIESVNLKYELIDIDLDSIKITQKLNVGYNKETKTFKIESKTDKE